MQEFSKQGIFKKLARSKVLSPSKKIWNTFIARVCLLIFFILPYYNNRSIKINPPRTKNCFNDCIVYESSVALYDSGTDFGIGLMFPCTNFQTSRV